MDILLALLLAHVLSLIKLCGTVQESKDEQRYVVLPCVLWLKCQKTLRRHRSGGMQVRSVHYDAKWTSKQQQIMRDVIWGKSPWSRVGALVGLSQYCTGHAKVC